MTEKTVLSPKEARKEIFSGEEIPFGATIEGSLNLVGVTINKGGLGLGGANIEGHLDLRGVTAEKVHRAAPTTPLVEASDHGSSVG